MKTIYSIILVVLCTTLLSGCGSDPVNTSNSGFLGNYDGFKERPWSDGARVYLRPGKDLHDLKKYNKLMLTPVEVWHAKGSEYKGVNPQELKYITDSFTKKLKAAFEPDYPFVTQPGPDVLVIRMALTGLEKKSPERSALGYIPIALLISASQKAVDSAQGEEEIVYRAALEAEGYDSVSGDRVVAVIDQRISDETDVKKGGSNVRVLDETLDYWVKRFRRNWDKAHK